MTATAIRCGTSGMLLACLLGCTSTTPTLTATQPASPTPADAVVIVPVKVAIPPLSPGVFDVQKVDVRPLAIFEAAPRYPFELRRAGISGEVRVLVTVGRDGSVREAMVVRATDIRFGQSALTAVSRWRFQPALVSGLPVDCRLLVPVAFNLRPTEAIPNRTASFLETDSLSSVMELKVRWPRTIRPWQSIFI